MEVRVLLGTGEGDGRGKPKLTGKGMMRNEGRERRGGKAIIKGQDKEFVLHAGMV